jgi:hypothetical protein
MCESAAYNKNAAAARVAKSLKMQSVGTFFLALHPRRLLVPKPLVQKKREM